MSGGFVVDDEWVLTVSNDEGRSSFYNEEVTKKRVEFEGGRRMGARKDVSVASGPKKVPKVRETCYKSFPRSLCRPLLRI